MWMRTGNSARPHGNCRVAWAWQGSSGRSCQWALPGKSSWRVAAVICSREAGLCPGINPVSCTNSPVKPSGKFCFHSLIPRSAFLTFFWKDCQELSLPPVSPVQGGALVGAQQAFLSLFRDRSWVTPLCKCALCTHIHQPVLWIGLSPFHPACKSLLPRNTSGKQAGIPERGTEVRKKANPVIWGRKQVWGSLADVDIRADFGFQCTLAVLGAGLLWVKQVWQGSWKRTPRMLCQRLESLS